jgi:hypothetical protein
MRTLWLLPLLLCAVACSAPDEPADPVEQVPDDEGLATIDPPAPATVGMFGRDDLEDDPDGDGLTTGQELEGWRIVVDEAGYPEDTDPKITPGDPTGDPDSNGLEGDGGVVVRVAHVSRIVTSNPDLADTDGDGLTDLEEFYARTDPRRPDTDGDGLTDRDELVRWKTNPRSVDTDGDARGPDKLLNPDPSLFDGAELDLDADGDPALTATSPLRGDTDGDGVDDFTEISNPTRSPIIADAPYVILEQTPDAEFDIFLNTEYSDTVSRAESFGASSSSGGVSSTAFSVGLGTKTDIEISATIKQSVSAGVAISLNPFEDIESETTLSANYSQNTQASVTTSFDSSYASSLAREAERARSSARERTRTTSDGGIRYPLDVVNRSDLAFDLRDLSVVASFYSLRKGAYLPLGVLTPEGAADTAFVMGPRERLSLIMRTDGVPEERMLEVMRNPTNLNFEVGYYTMTGATGRDFVFQQETVVRRCVTVELDLGQGDVRRYQVAAHVDRDPDGALRGVTLGEVFDLVGLEHRLVEVSDVDGQTLSALEIEGRGPEIALDPAPPLAADDYLFVNPPGDRFLVSGWFAGVLDADREPRPSRPDLTNLTVFPGDYVQLVYTSDRDRDGLSEVEEGAVGTNPALIDSDADGLSDYVETREGWLVEVAGEVPYRVFSSARTNDLDLDGFLDVDEFAAGTDPGRGDTDGDGIADLEDHARGLLGPQFPGPLAPDPIPLRIVVDSIDRFVLSNTGGAISFLVVHNFPLAELSVAWGDPTPDPSYQEFIQAVASQDPSGERRFTVSKGFTRPAGGNSFSTNRRVVIRARVSDGTGTLQETVCTHIVNFTLAPNSTAAGLYVTDAQAEPTSRCCTELDANNNGGVCP